jgi:hypothetical protein
MGRADGYLGVCRLPTKDSERDCVRILDDASYRLLLPLMGKPPHSKALIGYFRICHTGQFGPGTAEIVVVKGVSRWRALRVP